MKASFAFAVSVFALVLFLGDAEAFGSKQGRSFPRRKHPHFIKYKSRSEKTVKGEKANYDTYYYKTKVDKLSFSTEDTFEMRYLINSSFWGGPNSPIFFYAGNEGDVTGFADNTGVMFELGAEVGALILFAEHRYYGESKINDNENLNYLSAEQALADYAEFVEWIKSGGFSSATESPVIVFGGSYGGMLAAWMRIKYPFLVIGAWAASAPVAWFENLTDCNAYDYKVTIDFEHANENCPSNIYKSWDIIAEMGSTADGRQKLTDYFNLCSPLTDESGVGALIGEIYDAWGSVAMVNYPYPTEFLQPLPAWPVKVICEYLTESDYTDDELIQQIAKGVKVYYDYYSQFPCFNLSQGDIGLDDNLWGFQACSEMVMPMCSIEGKSMFTPQEWNLDSYQKYCENVFPGIGFRPDWMVIQYGARDISESSNIIFSNGALDPWAAGGVSDNMGNPTIYTLYIEDAAHHLDLRTSNPADPEPVKEVRAAEFLIVKGWLKTYYKEMIYSKAGKFPL